MAAPKKFHTLDATSHTAVLVCHRCPEWRAFGHTSASVWRLYADHCRRAHDDQRTAHYATDAARRTAS